MPWPKPKAGGGCLQRSGSARCRSFVVATNRATTLLFLLRPLDFYVTPVAKNSWKLGECDLRVMQRSDSKAILPDCLMPEAQQGLVVVVRKSAGMAIRPRTNADF